MTRCSWPQAGWASARPRSGTRSERRRRASRRPAGNTLPRPPTSALAWATATVSRLHWPSRLPAGRWRPTDSAGSCSSFCSREASVFCFLFVFSSAHQVDSMALVVLFCPLLLSAQTEQICNGAAVLKCSYFFQIISEKKMNEMHQKSNFRSFKKYNEWTENLLTKRTPATVHTLLASFFFIFPK